MKSNTIITPRDWWQHRAGCTRAMLSRCLANALGPLDECNPRLRSALIDALANQGSMTRAVTAYFVSIEMGIPGDAARALACGVEYLHIASLIFDDMPWMDDAAQRRGMPCLHITHGEATASLAALTIINRGYGLLWNAISAAPASKRRLAGKWVEDRLGPAGMIGGQSWDLTRSASHRGPREVERVAAGKTGDLLRLTLVLPAIIGRGTPREIERLDRLALLRGIAYQVADDLKDVLLTAAESGKTPGRDALLDRPNMIMSAGFQATLRRFKKLRRCADRVQSSLPGPPERWDMLHPLRVTLPPLSGKSPALLEHSAAV